MWFFKKKKNETEKILENKNFVQDMTSSIDVLLSLGKDSEDLTTILNELQDKVKYFNPSMNEDVLALDKKISNKLGDLKIEINKARTKGEYANAISLANEIKDDLVVERESKSKRR